MSSQKTILVVGATGKQGGSVARYLLKDGTFAVRCLVRSLESNASKELFNQGAQLVKGDLNNVDSLVNALRGVYGVFGVTNYWDPTVGYEGEIQQSKNLGDAALKAGVSHLVFSSLDRNSGVHHFESKVIGEDYIKSLGVPLTSLITSFYFENYIDLMPPKLEDGTWVFTVAQKAATRIPVYSVAETGGWVLQAFLQPKKYIGQDVAAVSEYISYPQIVETITRVTGKPAKFNEISLDVLRSFGFPGVEDLALNLSYFNEIEEGTKVDRRVILERAKKFIKVLILRLFLLHHNSFPFWRKLNNKPLNKNNSTMKLLVSAIS